MPTTLLLPGKIQTNLAEPDPRLSAYVHAEVLRAQSVRSTARGARAEEEVYEGALETDVLEFEYANGIRQWTSVAALRRDIASRGGARSIAGDEIRVPAVLTPGDTTRGKSHDLLLKTVRLIRADPADAIAQAAADLGVLASISRFERHLVPKPGLYTVGEGLMVGDAASPASTSDPFLLFIHGTASSTLGSFGGLVAGKETGLSINPPITAEWRKLVKMYSKRMLAFEHRTLSINPIENAIELAEALPVNAKLHIVTHSRGGLVGELLCLARPDAAKLDAIRTGSEHGREVADGIERLLSVLAKKKLVIERFVRVACPARGTILASDRLDTYLSLIFNLLSLIDPLRTNPILPFLEATILETAKRRTVPSELPGLEAQRPESALIRLLNTEQLVTDADLGIIAGDVQGEGIFKTLAILASDVFYLEKHDLVVNTAAMYGGMKRSAGALKYFESGGEVNHFNYFGNESTRVRLLEWLSGKKDNFEPLDRSVRGVSASRATVRSGQPTPILYLIPDFMATELGDVWPRTDALASGVAQLRLENALDVGQPVSRAYQEIVKFLSANYDVRPFGYDWRNSIEAAAKRLRDEVLAAAGAQRSVRFLCHGSGGLVLLAAKALYPEIAQVAAGTSVLAGTPLKGSWRAITLLLGRDKVARMLKLLDGEQTPDLAAVYASWPGLLELLPDEAYEPLFAARAGLRLDADSVARAREVREKAVAALDNSIPRILGISRETVSAMRQNAAEDPEFEVTAAGDGVVLASTSSKSTWYVDAAHGDLLDYAPVFDAIGDLLQFGTTMRLSQNVNVAASVGRPLREQPVLFPDDAALVDAAIVCGPREARPFAFSLQLSVFHANLTQAKYPVAVGHYEGDTIVSAERVLDNAFDGALSTRFFLGLYPGPENTVDVLLFPHCRPSGALVIGLGEVGDISPEKIRRGFLNAALNYALKSLEGSDRSNVSGGTPLVVGISSLLIGTFGAREISILDSVAAIVQATVEANRVLRSRELLHKVRIGALEFVELYEPRALRAADAIVQVGRRLGMELEKSERLEPEPLLRSHSTGCPHAPTNQYETGWWRRIRISQGKTDANTLTFEVLTDRARIEEMAGASQRGIVDGLIQDAVQSSEYDPDIGLSLFELLIPNQLKDKADYQTNTVLQLDESSAQIPWEMMAERGDNRAHELALRTGLLRQFKTSDFRPNPRMAGETSALVIGDPLTGDAKFPELLGARDEAVQVTDVLSRAGGYHVTGMINSTGLNVIKALYAREYKIVHIAAHGVFNEGGRTGVVLGRDTILTAAEVKQMRTTPDLVFLNCCHLGRLDVGTPLNKLAASIARELIDIGVRVVIAAGWAVHDSAARVFASTLYEGLLMGATFGKAVLEARQATNEAYPRNNTWAAYQCYGNPDFSLKLPRPVELVSIRRSRREYLDGVWNIKSRTSPDPQARTELLDELYEIDRNLPQQWRDGEMLAEMGDAYASLGDFAHAIEVWESAVLQENSEAPIWAIERLANTLDRYATSLMIDMKNNADAASIRERAAEQTGKAIKYLEWLLGLSKTSERLSLLGGAYKRKARTDDATRADSLCKSAEYYRRAHEMGRSGLYPTLNYLTMAYLAEPEKKQELLSLMREAQSAAAKTAAENPADRWARVFVPDAAVVEALISGGEIDSEALIEKYNRAIKGEGDARYLASIRGQIEMIAELEPVRKKAAALERIAAALRGV